jgi:hypothetical protein
MFRVVSSACRNASLAGGRLGHRFTRVRLHVLQRVHLTGPYSHGKATRGLEVESILPCPCRSESLSDVSYQAVYLLTLARDGKDWLHNTARGLISHGQSLGQDQKTWPWTTTGEKRSHDSSEHNTLTLAMNSRAWISTSIRDP